MEQAEAEQALAHLGEQWQALFETCSLGIAFADPTGRYVVTNSAFRRALHWTQPDLENALLGDLIEPKTVAGVLGELTETEGRNIQFEKHYKHRDGSVSWLKVRVSLTRKTQSMPSSLLVLADDITAARNTEEALRESEKRLRTIFELN